MTQDTVLELGRDAMFVTLLVSAPMLVSGMIVGLVISVFQSVTQIQEITLTFVPKIVVVMLAFLLFMPWMMGVLLSYVQPLFGGFDALVR
jgi:flagellar biosynthetic protein FliQ